MIHKIDKLQKLLKFSFVIYMFLFSANVAASYWLECIGSITIQSEISESIADATNTETYVTADIFIHEYTFSCRGHGKKINKKGVITNENIFLPTSLNENMLKKGSQLQVKFEYSDWAKQSISEENSISKWTALKIIKTIPPLHKKQIKSLDSQSTQTVLAEGLKRYNGNYFLVDYPADFLVSPSGPIQSFIADVYLENFEKAPNVDPMETYYYIDTDEVYLTSPDDSVEFFVYSPQWSGRPLTYLKAQDNESIVSHESKKTIKSGVHYGFIQTKRMTFRAKNNSYKRSFVHQRACHSNELKNCITHVFGIKYKDNKSYLKYRNSYLSFKASLQQFSD